MLKAVRMPISRRTGPAKRMAGWNFGANINPIPAWRMQRATPSASSSIFTPSPSSRSAEPHTLDAARLPCLATVAPLPAATNAAVVEMLNVPERIAAGAAGIQHRAVEMHRRGLLAHHLGHAGDLGLGFALEMQRGQKGGDLRRRGRAGHNLLHRLGRLGLREILAAHQLNDLITN